MMHGLQTLNTGSLAWATGLALAYYYMVILLHMLIFSCEWYHKLKFICSTSSKYVDA